MKKIIICFIILISLFSYYLFYKDYENLEWQKSTNPNDFSNFSFVLADEALLSDPEIIYPIIKKTAKELGVNVFRHAILYREENSVDSIYYILLTTKTKLFNTFDLKDGRYLEPSETQSEEAYLSSNTKKDQYQIGTIKVFGDKNVLMFRPLIDSYHQIPVTGEYHIESMKPIEKTVFYETLAKNFNEKLNPQIAYTSEDFTSDESIDSDIYMPTDTSMLSYLKFILAGVIALLVFYYTIHQGRAIAVYKMHGLTNIRIWMMLTGKILSITFILTTSVLIVLLFFQEGWYPVFIYKFVLQQILIVGIIMFFSISALIYINTIKLNAVLKNRKDTKLIIIFNILLKSILFIVSILLISSLVDQISKIDYKKAQLTNWEQSAEYGVFYPFFVGLDNEDLNKNNGLTTYSAISELYTLLNKSGSLLINTKYYEQNALRLPYEGIRFISVNPNYLKKFPVISEENKEVVVEEAIQHQILLVPSKYKDKEQVILEYFHKNQLDNIVYQKDSLQTEVPEQLASPDFRIIWTQDHQKIFSFNPEVFPNENNMIIDPIIKVVTEKNSLAVDKHVILGGGATDPLKVRLINNDSLLTYNSLKNTLRELQLDDNLKYLVTINHIIFKQLNDLKQERLVTMLILVSIIICVIFILVQNTILMFNNQKKLFIVRGLFGVGFINTYRSILYTFLGTWLAQLIITIIFTTISSSIAFIVLALLMIELFMIVLTIIVLENKNKISILKGGI
ncbi:bacteriocin-associated integral membrane protein [Sporosarcina luteola]|nr:bacteriocin-associated integral membrane protein [Sporosarcina luteola]